MKKSILAILAAGFVGGAMFTGCASTNAVEATDSAAPQAEEKKEEAAPAAAPAEAAPATTPAEAAPAPAAQ